MVVSEEASNKLAIEGRCDRGCAICCLLSAFGIDFRLTLCTEMFMMVWSEFWALDPVRYSSFITC